MTMYVKPLPCEIRINNSLRADFLYMDNDRVVVLLNNLRQDADLGPLEPVRKRHILPEADILVIPRKDVAEITFYE